MSQLQPNLEIENLVTELLEFPVWVPEAMEPGSLYLLTNRFALSPNRSPKFTAVLACPRCGTLGLITEAQYSGEAAVVCDSELCGCHFVIRDKSWFLYPPIH